LHVRAVVDLRTGVEVRAEGPGPMNLEPNVDVQHLSLFPEGGETTDLAAAEENGGPVVLPWQNQERSADTEHRGASGIYLRYLDDRADSIIAALRVIARTDGATIVHCAAGKDRTGVVVAFALAEVGVRREAIIADYAHSAERIEAIYGRLAARRTYQDDLDDDDIDKHRPKAVTMERLLDAVDELHGGVATWLRANGWTADDAARLRHKLLD
jgi:protein-tyrosine phosphatase